MVANKIYSCNYSGIKHIFLYKGDSFALYINVGGTYSKSSWSFWNSSTDIKLADNDECEWLIECINKNAFISKELINFNKIHEIW